MNYDEIDAKHVREMAEVHWEWLLSVMSKQREMEHKLFVDAFLHGYKHATVDGIERARWTSK